MPKRHVIRDGDSVIKLSDEHGFFARTIWNDPANASLRANREDMNVLKAGDVVTIPDKRPKDEPAETGREHVFRRRGVPAVYRVQMFDGEEPRAHQAYKLTVDGKQTYSGTTDGTGLLEEYVPATSRQGVLVIGEDQFQLKINFGYLDPIEEISGVQKRLLNLGFDCGPVDGEPGPRTEAALLAFQEEFELEQTGEADEVTVRKLGEVHDGVNEFPEDDADQAAGPGDS